MYPNPQDVLPLPPRPSLEQYKKRAKELVKACRSGDPSAFRSWAAQWVEALDALHRDSHSRPRRERIDRAIEQVTEFARAQLSRGGPPSSCSLADAQYVIARAHGFESWPTLVKHLATLGGENAAAAFERAADAIVRGDTVMLARLLREHPDLIRARSNREHRCTLLHYVSANGVENYRQKTPKNALDVTRILLDWGAEVDAEADVYGGGATTLGLVATSAHPRIAGVQNDLIDLLLAYGARLDLEGGGNRHSMVEACLANGCPEAAEHMAALGAPLDLATAAGVGRLDVVKRYLDEDGRAGKQSTLNEMSTAFGWACGYGRGDVAEFLLQRGMKADTKLPLFGRGSTGLHMAAYAAHVNVVSLLLRHGAAVDVTDDTWHTAPLVWALHAWRHEPQAAPERYHEVVSMLVAAGAVVSRELLDDEIVRADAEMLAALTRR
jgi:ankyrin repeat protein